MSKQNLLLIALLLTGFFNSNSQHTTLHLDPSIKFQAIRSIGGNYCNANYTPHAYDSIGDYTLHEFKPSHVRVALPLKIKNKSFKEYRGNKYLKQYIVIEVLEELQKMKFKYGVNNITVSAWDVPDEWVENPEQTEQRTIKKESYTDVIETITNFLLHAKKTYGVEVDHFSFNEADGGYQILFTPQQATAFIKQAGARFKKAGLKTTFLLGDTSKTEGTVEYISAIVSDPQVLPYLGPISFHAWWSEQMPDSEFERVAMLGKKLNKEIWCGELGFDAMAWKQKGSSQNWDFALRFAKISMRMFKYSQTVVSLYWTWQNNYAIMSADTKTKYPSYYVTKQQVNYFNRNAQLVQCVSSDPSILTIASIQGRRIAIQVLNEQDTEVTVSIDGIKANHVQIISTSNNNPWEEAEADTLSGLVLKPKSISVLVLNL